MEIRPQDIQRLYQMLSASRRTLIVTHARPDGDALGSSFGLKHLLDAYPGPRTNTVLLHDTPTAAIAFLADSADQSTVAYASDIQAASKAMAEADLLVCLDCSNLGRVEKLAEQLRALSCPKILIDHHLNPAVEEFDLVFSECAISSASELLFWIIRSLPGVEGRLASVPSASLTCLMAGMTTDTNNFANSVYPSTFAMASELLEAGVNRDSLIQKLFNSHRENRLRMIGYLLDNRLHITEHGVAYTLLDSATIKRFDIADGELEGYVNMPLSIADVKMSIFLKEDQPGCFRASLRSKKGTSANACAVRYFNGGGHEQASGGKLTGFGNLEELEKYVVDSINEFFAA